MENLSQHLSFNLKSHLIIDFDETLFHLHLEWNKFRVDIRDILSQYDQDAVSKWQEGTFELIQAMIDAHGPKLRQKILDYCDDFESKQLKPPTPNKKLIQFIKDKKDKYTYHIWSSNMTNTIAPILDQYHLTKYFDIIITKNLVYRIKPDPEGFHMIYNKHHSKSDYLMIGNSPNDADAAKNAGIDYFQVSMK